MKKWIGEGLKSEGTNKNVLNILRTLVEDEESTVYVPYNYVKGYNDYKVEGDPRVHFYPAESGRPAKIMSVLSNSERYNFSIVCLVDVLVEYYEGDKVELKQKKVWRTYNVVRDGKLVIDKVSVRLSKDAFESLRDADLLYYNGVKVGHNHSYVKDFTYILHFENIPIVSVNWAQPDRIGLCRMIMQDTFMSGVIKALKKIRSEFAPLEDTNYDDSEKEIYKESVEYVKNEEHDKESVDCLVYRIPGYKYELGDEDIKTMKTVYKDYETVQKEIDRTKSALTRTRFLYRSVIYAIESTRLKGSFDWSEEEKLPRSKDKMVKRANVEMDNGKTVVLERISYKKEV